MRRSLCELSPDELRTEHQWLTSYIQQAHRISPRHFRNLILLPDQGRPIADCLTDWQCDDFAALDGAWQAVVDCDDVTACNRAWLERPRGHSKTSDTAVMVAWALVAGDGPISGLAAVDKDQARLLKTAIERLIASNPERLAELRVTADGVRNSITGASLRIISSDAASSYGELVDFILCDELCHWPRPELWHSLISTAAKRAHCLLMVLTNAGWGTGWQWQARESARTLESWYFSSLSGSQAPWISVAALEEQQRTLPPPVYRRLWLNEWQHSNGEFVTLEEAEACCDEGLTIAEAGRDGVSYLAVIDYGEKCDYTAAVIAHRDGDRVVIDRLDVAVPTDARPVPVQWVEDWLERQGRLFPNLSVCVDPSELKGVAQRWSSRLWVERFSFAGGRGNHEMAIALRQAILNRKVAWPKGCGRITSVDGSRDDLETELAGLIVKETGRGRLRFDHAIGRHDDRAFVVAVACLKLATELESTAMVVEDGVG